MNIFFIYSLIYYIPPVVSLVFFSPIQSRPPPLSLRSTPPPVPFRKGQASQRYQPNMTSQVTVRLGTHPHTKAVRGSPVGEKGYQKQAKQPETDPSSHC